MALQYVSLLNTSYSGSTLVSMLLCSQPRVIGFGDTYVGADPRHYPKHPCTCGQWFDECPPRVVIREAVRAGGFPDYDWDRASATPIPRRLPSKLRQHWVFAKPLSLPILRAMPEAMRKSIYRDFYLENTLMLEGLDETGSYDIYFDGCKSLVRTELLRTYLPDFKVLHMVRHPGAFLYHFHKNGDFDYEKRLGQWKRYNHHARSFEKLLPDGDYLAVTYESVVQRPEAFLDRMEGFMGLPSSDGSPRARIRRDDVHIIGNRMRETTDRILDLSNTWRGKLPSAVEEHANRSLEETAWVRDLYSDVR